MAGRKATYEGYLNRLKGRKLYGYDEPVSRLEWEVSREIYYNDNGTFKGFNDYMYDKTVYRYSVKQAEALMRAQEEGRFLKNRSLNYYRRKGSEEVGQLYEDLQESGYSKKEAAKFISYYIYGSP